MHNLLSNALRFTKLGGHIELGAAADDSGDQAGIRIWVKDDGVGISSERQPQVFESFKSSRGGTGLGPCLSSSVLSPTTVVGLILKAKREKALMLPVICQEKPH